ncbi:hypothetical protein [Dactylosporangium sp. CA-233914]|uniref:hypothetical protein n=1 Tax=Dactylosporangium sp. CA-233914 TaxID=3239934 RepID=UPI003D8D9038
MPETSLVLDLDGAEGWPALVRRLRERRRPVVVDLAGDLGSYVAAVLACDALGPANVAGLSMPLADTVAPDIREFALRTGLDFRLEPVQAMVDAFQANLTLDAPALSRLQGRVRQVVLLALAETEQRLVLTVSGDPQPLARWRNAQSSPAPIPEPGM